MDIGYQFTISSKDKRHTKYVSKRRTPNKENVMREMVNQFQMDSDQD